MSLIVHITPNDKGNPPGKLADAELHFTGGELDGLKLIGFSIWERRGGGGRNVTFPARQYVVNGEKRTFALLRPITDVSAQDRIRDLVLQAFDEHDERLHHAGGDARRAPAGCAQASGSTSARRRSRVNRRPRARSASPSAGPPPPRQRCHIQHPPSP